MSRVSTCVPAILAGLGWLLLVPSASAQNPPSKPPSDLDAFMARVLERRDENWRKLHDYVLDETERIELVAPSEFRLHGQVRDFTWYVREGFLVRSPVRANGVEVPEPERREYERNWLASEKKREERRKERAAKGGKSPKPAPDEPQPEVDPDSAGLDGFVDQRGEPRFVSEAYFLNFKFEPGNYYLVGRETFEGREVYKIEYYPTNLFHDDGEHRDERTRKSEKPAPTKGSSVKVDVDRKQRRAEVSVGTDEDEIERKMNKVALVTLWVEPTEHQIVKYTFDNVDFGFLPGRWLVRVDDIRASMTMSRVLDGVWLPREIAMQAALTLANGDLRVKYGRTFYDYKKAETSARVRVIRDGGE